MKKYICAALLICLSTLSFSQDIFINGVNKNRPLTWDDFKGTPDTNSTATAFTVWNINYSLNGISFKGDTVKISNFAVKLEFDEKKSWSKPEKQTNILLKHEQGHFDLGLICQREILRQLNNAVFLKADFQNKLQTIFSSTLEKYRLLGLKYDAETSHSINQPAQNNWNVFFATELK
jgi:hypothetical protein